MTSATVGKEKAIFDTYGNQFFYGSSLLGTFMSLLAGIWKFMTKDRVAVHKRPSMRLHALIEKINEVKSEIQVKIALISFVLKDIYAANRELYTSSTRYRSMYTDHRD